MTREEAIKVLQRMKYPYKCNKHKMIISNVDRDNEALEMAIQALSQEPPSFNWVQNRVDLAKAEINNAIESTFCTKDEAIGLGIALNVIDKYFTI